MFVECGIWETFRLLVPDGLGSSVLIQSHYYWLFLHPSKSKRRDVAIVVAISLVCVLFDPAIPTSFFNFIQLFLYLFLFFFNALS